MLCDFYIKPRTTKRPLPTVKGSGDIDKHKSGIDRYIYEDKNQRFIQR